MSVIILTKNQSDLLNKSIPVLLLQQGNFNYEIIVMDSGSTDGAIEYLETQKIKLLQIKPEEFQYAGTFNYAVKYANGKLRDVLEHPNKVKFGKQRIYIVEVNDYIYGSICRG